MFKCLFGNLEEKIIYYILHGQFNSSIHYPTSERKHLKLKKKKTLDFRNYNNNKLKKKKKLQTVPTIVRYCTLYTVSTRRNIEISDV